MKKSIFLTSILFVSMLVCLTGYGQASDSSVQYQNKRLPAAVIELPYPPSVVDAAMGEYLSKKGKSRSTDIKGFTTFRNTQPTQNDSINSDLYFKTERKSRKEKEVTVVSLLVMQPDTQTSAGNILYLSMDDAKTYLNDLSQAIESFNVELMIKEQNDAVAKAEAKYKALVNDGDDLEKRRTEIVKKLSNNQNDQQLQLKEIENQKQKLTQRVGQRKS